MSKRKTTNLSQPTSTPPSSIDKALSSSTQQAVIQSMGFSGPLPPPSLLSDYEQVHQGLGERLVIAFEKEGDHRRALEKSYYDLLHTAQQNGQVRATRGQLFAFIIAMFALSASAFLGALGHTVAASIIAGVDIVGVTSVFLFERTLSRKELPAKEMKNPSESNR